MITNRIRLNIVVFLALSAFLVGLGLTTLVFQPGGGKELTVDFTDAAGLAPRNDVTMRGVPVGAVRDVKLMDNGLVRVWVSLEPGVVVPEGTSALITRRSPIGDLTLELISGEGDPMTGDLHIDVAHTQGPPDPEKTIEVLARVLHSVPSTDLKTVLAELSTALRGRGEDLASLSETTADLPEAIWAIREDLERLITTGPKVTSVFADNAPVLADDITQTALLADLLRDRRYDLVKLSSNGADFAKVFGSLLQEEKANIACLIEDFGGINSVLARPDNLENLKATLDLNHYFFDAVEISVVPGKDGIDWFRVQLLPHTEPAATQYAPQRYPPDVLQGNSCTSRYGKGVGPGTQPGGVYLVGSSKIQEGK